jgi:hypothetical protein
VPSQIFPRSHSAIAHATDVTQAMQNRFRQIKKEKNLFFFLDLLRMAAKVFKYALFF